ncbi:hypothetical protein [Nocardioides sp. J54]|nr:hypothetical protein [Nocardioides sp. J54]
MKLVTALVLVTIFAAVMATCLLLASSMESEPLIERVDHSIARATGDAS